MNNLFYQLIRVSIGTQESLSHLPSSFEWEELYLMAKKQCLVGVCFAGLQRLKINAGGDFARIGINMNLYLIWMGMSAKIQQKNLLVDEQCVALQKQFSADGMFSSILKGQGLGQLYAEHLLGLRQSGDIDIFVAGGITKLIEYCRQKYSTFDWDYVNAHLSVYIDTKVELHWRVHSHPNIFKNKNLQKWLIAHEEDVLGSKATLSNGESIVVPTAEFNLFFIMLHSYHHMFESGLGLRQLMDYYFVLKSSLNIIEGNQKIISLFEYFGMMKFVSAVMWIMQQVFGLEHNYLLCEPNEKEGIFLLNEVMQNGNFGHYDERMLKIRSKWISPFVSRMQHNWHLFSHYPKEFFWAPIWLIYHFVWKRYIPK